MPITPVSAGKRILIIVQNLPVPFDRRVWQEATALKAHGYEVAVICPAMREYTARYECLQGIHIYRHPLPLEAKGALGYVLEYASSLFWELVLSLKVLRRHGFDAIHACNPPTTSSSSACSTRRSPASASSSITTTSTRSSTRRSSGAAACSTGSCASRSG